MEFFTRNSGAAGVFLDVTDGFQTCLLPTNTINGGTKKLINQNMNLHFLPALFHYTVSYLIESYQ